MVQTYLMALALTTFLPLAASAATFTSGDFDAWQSETIAGPDGGQQISILQTGGNPDAYLEAATQVSDRAATFHFDPMAVYDPATMGGIEEIAFSLSSRFVSSSGTGQNGQNYAMMIAQDGAYHYLDDDGYPCRGFCVGRDTEWKTVSKTTSSTGDFGTYAGTGTLDFSEMGGEMTFGFYTANSGSPTAIAAYDNFDVTITPAMADPSPVPVPATLPMLLAGLTAAGLWGRKART